jgi:hypothetical protein
MGSFLVLSVTLVREEECIKAVFIPNVATPDIRRFIAQSYGAVLRFLGTTAFKLKGLLLNEEGMG